MRFIIMHKTNAHWEAGAIPRPELIACVGALLAELASANALLAGEGLRPSSEGVRLQFSGGTRTVLTGPFAPSNELPAAFTIVRASSLDEAIECATRQAHVLGDVEIDIRPVTEAWDIGMSTKPNDVTTRRYMLLRKATAATEAGEVPTPAQRDALAQLIADMTRRGMHLSSETLRPSRRGRRYLNSREGISVFDGPFAETKEMIGGYVIVAAASLDDAGRFAVRYINTVEAAEVDVRELDEPESGVTTERPHACGGSMRA
jgi:hypothetical protein